MNNKHEVALSLSGGGFRAAMFHLGTLHYLHNLKYPNGECFLDNINTISTISGGTITGLWYMIHFCKGDDIEQSLKELYNILITYDLPTKAINAIVSEPTSRYSLIREMVDIYDDMLFHGETFKAILEKIDDKHIHHFSANGTDFSNGLAFRFQASRKIINAKPEYSRGVIGNNIHRVPWDVAGQIKLSEILAVSSCFPGGFEPIKFPHDFALGRNKDNKEYVDGLKPFDLMDGGIVDNQGIEPLLLASMQMTYDNPTAQGNTQYPSHDLIIVSDVASADLGKVTDFNINLSKQMSLNRINNIIIVGLVLALSCGVLSYVFQCYIGLGASIATFTLISMAGLFLLNVERKLFTLMQEKSPFKISWAQIKHLRFYKIGKLIEPRLSSLLQLAQAVFMKPIRQMRYNALYNDKRWNNRCITNNVSELSTKGTWRWKKDFPEYLKPSGEIKVNSDLAYSFGTTLWFTDQDKTKGVPDALFCAGQYTICMNLLEFIEKLRNNKENTTSFHYEILNLEQQLKKDWNNFRLNPLWMLDKIK